MKRAVPPESRPGRKKDVRRFELEIFSGEGNGHTNVNEVAFFLRTSGGTPLNATDTKKVAGWILLQLKLLGHKMRRKGQELDPAPKDEKPTVETKDDHETPTEIGSTDTEESPVSATTPDGDDSDSHTAAPTEE